MTADGRIAGASRPPRNTLRHADDERRGRRARPASVATGGIPAHTLEGRVESTLPRGLFSVRTSEGTVVAGIGREAIHLVRIKPGDTVDVRVSPRDPTRGRIVAMAETGRGGR